MSISQPRLSIVIVAFKSRDEIRDCLSSIPRNLIGMPVEVVVVDNSPGDGTGDIILTEFPYTRYIPSVTNLGFGRANNLGFSQTGGGVVLFLNPDTICNEQSLRHCVMRTITEEALGLISPQLVLLDGSMDLACRRSIPTFWDGFCRASGLSRRFSETRIFAAYNLTYLSESGSYEVGAINGAFMMGRRDVFSKVGVFDENFFMYGDDLDLCIKIARAGYKIVYDGSTHIVHKKGLSVNKNYEQMSEAVFDANRDVYLKHFNPRGNRLVALKYKIAFGLWKKINRLRASVTGRQRVRPA